MGDVLQPMNGALSCQSPHVSGLQGVGVMCLQKKMEAEVSGVCMGRCVGLQWSQEK